MMPRSSTSHTIQRSTLPGGSDSVTPVQLGEEELVLTDSICVPNLLVSRSKSFRNFLFWKWIDGQLFKMSYRLVVALELGCP